jgi:hypothetical protein
MPQPVGSTIDMLLDLGLETLVGALVLAVLIAMLTAGAYFWMRRGKSDTTAILVTLIVVANLACLVTGAGFIESRSHFRRFGPSLLRTGSHGSDQENGQVGVSRRSVRSVHRWRRTSLPGRAAPTRLSNSEAAAVSPE